MSDEITEGFAEFVYKDNDDCAKIWKDVINLDSTDSKFEKKDSPILVNKKGVADMQRKGDSTVYVKTPNGTKVACIIKSNNQLNADKDVEKQKKQRMQRQVMALFYAVIFVLAAISLICIGNSVAMRVRHMAAEQRILNLLGMTKVQLLFLYVRRYAVAGIAGGIISIIPASVYSFFVRYALKLSEKAYQDNTTEILSLEKPWVYGLPTAVKKQGLYFRVSN